MGTTLPGSDNVGRWSWLGFVAVPDNGESDRSDTPVTVEDLLTSARAYYQPILGRGLEHLFEPCRDTCPWCGSRQLRVRLRSPDMFQRKPGRFVLEECRSCGHIFQNPRLTPEGLEFYYRDFYDGLGATVAEYVFSLGADADRSRAQAVLRHINPVSWLDVGTGHGHFPLHARSLLPETHFDGLDIGARVIEAARLGRIRHGHRGTFPDFAGQIAEPYDVVSLHHYLEHTRDPRAELDALASTVRAGGYAEIEMPDVSCGLARPLRSLWVPWFQPQHQHLLPLGNLLAALVERGFAPVSVERHGAHSAVDLTFALIFVMTAVAPDPRWPWARRNGAAWRRRRHELAWTKAFPPLAAATSRIDGAIDRLLERLDRGNAYRIVARKER